MNPASTYRSSIWLPLGIALGCSLLLLPTIFNGFVWDDGLYIGKNPYLSLGLWEGLRACFSHFFVGNYQPLTIFTYWLEFQVFGKNPMGYHAVNVVLHGVNTLLVWYVTQRFLGRPWASTIAAILFGIHPMHLESVAWISERKDLLYVGFYLGALLAYGRYRLAGEAPNSKAVGYKWYGLALILCLMAMLSKALAVTLPLAFLLIDYFQERSFGWKVWMEKLPFFTLSLVFGILAIYAQQDEKAIYDTATIPLFSRFIFASYGLVMYLVKLFLPYGLSGFHPYPDSMLSWYYAMPLIVALMVGVLYWYGRRQRVLVFGVLFFLLTLLPVLQLLPVGDAVIAERYSYLSYVGCFLVLGWGIDWWIQRQGRWVPLVVVGLVMVVFSGITVSRIHVWENNYTFWSDVLRLYPDSPKAYLNRGVFYFEQDNWPKALEQYDAAILLKPGYHKAYYNRALVQEAMGNTAKALDDLDKSIRLQPSDFHSYYNRGRIYQQQQEFDKALADYEWVIQHQPAHAEAWQNKGLSEIGLQQYAQARQSLTQAIQLAPSSISGYINRGAASFQLNDLDAAMADFDRALEIDPVNGQTLYNKALIHYLQGEKTKAKEFALKAQVSGYAVDPEFVKAVQ